MFKKVDTRKIYSEMEKEILAFWKENKIFERSVTERDSEKNYSFYDGPPFITGVPHYGTLLSSIVKDAVPRFFTMKGFRVERRWGWDCHGLPAENMVEKKLGIKSKREIEEKVGIEKFNANCFEETSKIAGDWEEMIDRIGRWVDMKNAYKTMDTAYMESVWWAFSELYKKNLIYEDVRVSLYCPRCATPLSNFEIAMDNSYEEDKDPSVFVNIKRRLAKNERMKTNGNEYFLVWTTTPWTLLANVALAIGKNINYTKIRCHSEPRLGGEESNKKVDPSTYPEAGFAQDDNIYIIAKDKVASLFAEGDYEIIEEFKGSELVGQEYEPIFPHKIENGYKVIATDFVTTDDGTGIVHLAPAFGDDDFQARQDNNLPMIINVDDEGRFTDGEWKGEKVWEANEKVVEWLEKKEFLFKKENIIHSYPHCHRCHTKLIYKAQDAWFINIQKIKNDLIARNENINWFPAFLKNGRFGKGIESAPDWNISRDRYWGTAMPVWKCSGTDSNQRMNSNLRKCDNIRVIGSYEELEKISGIKLKDYHRPKVDEVTFPCEKCGGTMKRIPQVFDCWMESGSMPFAQFHYPFENKEKFEKSFPTDFISEYIAQTRAWFYVVHVLSVAIFDSESYKNVVATGVIGGSDGRKMSKSYGNFPDPNIVLEKYSADALRFYLLSSPLLNAQNINFSEDVIRDIQRKTLATLWNSYSFFVLYANADDFKANSQQSTVTSDNLLDKWIISELNILIQEVDGNMMRYDLVRATKPIEKFVDNLSNWYIRRSRKRFWKSENEADTNAAYETLHYVLVTLAKVMAPFTPFVAEEIYKNLNTCHSERSDSVVEESKKIITGSSRCSAPQDEEVCSVHLENFPEADENLIDEKLNNQMIKVREIVSLGLQKRAEAGIKVRQPLRQFSIFNFQFSKELVEIIKEEVNVKEVILDKKFELPVLDTEISEELKLEGQAREIIRYIQEMRKEASFEVDNRIKVCYNGKLSVFSKFGAMIAKETLADSLDKGNLEDFDIEKEFKINEELVKIQVKKI
jgi:isoleucyl-tRNA synthetase